MTSGSEKNSSMSLKSKFELDSDYSPRFGCLAPLIIYGCIKQQNNKGSTKQTIQSANHFQDFPLNVVIPLTSPTSEKNALFSLFFFAVSLYSSSESPTGKFPQVTSSSLFYFISLVLFTCAQPCKHSPNTPADKLALQQTVTPAERPTEMCRARTIINRFRC